MSPKTPLLRPVRYFSEWDDALRSGGVMFVIYVLAGILQMVALLGLFLSKVGDVPSGIGIHFVNILLIRSATGFLAAVVGWFVVAGVMHYLIGGDSTAGTYDDALAVAGWAYAPNVAAMPVTLALAWNRLGGVGIGTELGTVLEAANGMSGQPSEFFVALAVAVWSAYVLAGGTAATHDVSTERTIAPAAIVGFGSFVLALFSG